MLRAIKRTIEQSEIRTISVDIFDTVLLRTLHPESARFHRIAQAWHDVLKHRNITVEELVDIRAEVTLALRAVDEDRGGDGETTITHIIDGVIYLLESRHHLTVSSTERHTLLSALIEAELRTEEAMLKPHRALQKLLQKAKERGARIYFLSDMYLSGDHIRRLLRHYNCDALFDDGVTSSDIGMNKGTGRAYRKMILEKGFGDIDVTTHLHIGDHTYCDTISPRKLGINALQHCPYGQRLRIAVLGTLHRVTMLWTSICRQRKLVTKYQSTMMQAESMLTPKEKVAFSIGTRFAPGIATYLSFLSLYAHAEGSTIHFLSGEGAHLNAFLQKIDPRADSNVISTMNRYIILCAVLQRILHTPHSAYDQRLSTYILKRFDDTTFPSFLRSLMIDEDGRLLILRTLHFAQNAKDTTDHATIVDALRREYDNNESMRHSLSAQCTTLKQMLWAHGIMDAHNTLIADVGWLGTIQFLLEIFCEEQDAKILFHGVYLGTKIADGDDLTPRCARGVLFSPSKPALTGLILTECLWEYVLEAQTTSSVQQAMQSGLSAGIDFLVKHRSIAPRELFRATLPRLIRFMNIPTRSEVHLIGQQLFDLGLGMEKKKPILTSIEKEKLRFRPRRTLRRTRDQLWQTGFLVQHRLYGALLVRFILQLTRAWRSW